MSTVDGDISNVNVANVLDELKLLKKQLTWLEKEKAILKKAVDTC